MSIFTVDESALYAKVTMHLGTCASKIMDIADDEFTSRDFKPRLQTLWCDIAALMIEYQNEMCAMAEKRAGIRRDG